MWIPRRLWTVLVADNGRLDEALERERAKVLGLERALAISQTNADHWRVLVNTLSQDRERIAAAKGLDLPGPRIEGRLQTPAAVTAAAVEGPAVVGRSLEEAETVEDALAMYKGHVDGFEDVGDAQADALGIAHADDGTLEYTR